MGESLDTNTHTDVLLTFDSLCEDAIDHVLHDASATMSDPIFEDARKKYAVRLELNKKFHEQKKRVVHAVITVLAKNVRERVKSGEGVTNLLSHWASYEVENLYGEVLHHINTDADILTFQHLVGSSFPEAPLTLEDARALTVPLVTDLAMLNQKMTPYVFRAYIAIFLFEASRNIRPEDIELVIQRTTEKVQKGLRV